MIFRLQILFKVLFGYGIKVWRRDVFIKAVFHLVWRLRGNLWRQRTERRRLFMVRDIRKVILEIIFHLWLFVSKACPVQKVIRLIVGLPL